jgi:hypothetical protein
MHRSIGVFLGLVISFAGACSAVRSNAASDADPLENYIGLWLVVPSAGPKAPAPGGIPRVFRIWREGGLLSGLFTWNGQDFFMRNLASQNDSLTFEIVAKNPDAWIPGPAPMIAKRSQDGRQMDVWFGHKAEGEVTFPTVRLTQAQLDAVIQMAPKIDPWQKRPLPALREVPANSLARTPPMGWSSWNVFRSSIDDRTIREIADAMVSSGLRDAGYVYVNIDDSWQGRRDAAGVLNANEKFRLLRVVSLGLDDEMGAWNRRDHQEVQAALAVERPAVPQDPDLRLETRRLLGERGRGAHVEPLAVENRHLTLARHLVSLGVRLRTPDFRLPSEVDSLQFA